MLCLLYGEINSKGLFILEVQCHSVSFPEPLVLFCPKECKASHK